MAGEKNKMAIKKKKRRPFFPRAKQTTECRCGEKSRLSWSSLPFFFPSFFPRFFSFANSYPLVPPSYKSVPDWSPCSSLPPPVFLVSAGTLPPPLARSLSPILCLPHSLSRSEHALSIFPSFSASVPLVCPLVTLTPRRALTSGCRRDFEKEVSQCFLSRIKKNSKKQPQKGKKSLEERTSILWRSGTIHGLPFFFLFF